MSERYTKVFDLPKNMYAENAPIVISAGALLKDNQTGTILAQLKIKNITNKVIKAAKISILSFDTVGKQIGDETNHEYLDLSVGRDYEFGQKVPIILSNNSTRSFSVTVNEIIFTDNSIWNYGGEEWAALKEAKKLTSILSDSEAVKQFKIEYGEKCEYEAAEDKDIWICSCGKINKKEESKCFSCGCSLQILKNVDLAKLNENKDIRVAKEKEAADEKQRNIKKQMKRCGIVLAIIIPIVVIISVFVNNYNQKVELYNKGISLMSSSPNEAINIFNELGDFKDSKEKIPAILEDVYNSAVDCLNNGDSAQAYTNFSYLKEYKDSEEMLQVAQVQNLIDCFPNKGNQLKEFSKEEFRILTGEEIQKKLVGFWIECPKSNPNASAHSSSQLYSFNADGTYNTTYNLSNTQNPVFNFLNPPNWKIEGNYLVTWITESFVSKYEIREYNEDVLILNFVNSDGSLTISKLLLKVGSEWADRYAKCVERLK